MESLKPWPKSNDFGQPHYRTFSANNAWSPYFGESIKAIRIQYGIERHAFNAKSGDQRFWP